MTDGESSKINESLIDWGRALQSVGGSEDILGSIVEAALEELPQLNEQLSAAVEVQDIPTAHRAAHTIGGAVRIFNAEPVIEIARQIEKTTADGSLDNVPKLHQQLNSLIQRAISELQSRQQ